MALPRTSATFTIALIFAAAAQANPAQPPRSGRIVYVGGQALVFPSEGAGSNPDETGVNAGQRKPAEKLGSSGVALVAGQTIFEGDLIRTGKDGIVKVLMTDRTILDVKPSSSVRVEKMAINEGADRDVSLGIGAGIVRVAVPEKVGPKGSFRVRTNGTTMGVRGTEFIVNASRNSVAVIGGRVEVTANTSGAGNSGGAGRSTQAPQMVSAGQSLQAGGRATSMDANQARAASQGSRISDSVLTRPSSGSGNDSSGSGSGAVSPAAMAAVIAKSALPAPPSATGAGGFIGAFGPEDSFDVPQPDIPQIKPSAVLDVVLSH